MPELPDLTVYQHALAARACGQTFSGLRLRSAFVLRSVVPAPADLAGRRVIGVGRIAKQLVIELEADHFIVIHLMVAGRLHWKRAGTPIIGRNDLAAFDFDTGTLTLTEASKKRRASVHLVAGRAALAAFDPGGIDVMRADAATFRAALARDNHTLKRALTDQHLVAGIGNAYSDEILHRARLSPFRRTQALSEAEWQTLHACTQSLLAEWIERLSTATGDGFPEKVTAFRPEMGVHGRYRQPCPQCGASVQRIVYAENEANYCARCQTEGRLLADRALSRLLKANWPRTPEELERR